MDTDQGQAPLHRGNHSNPSPHIIPPDRGPLAIFFQGRGKISPIGGTHGKILGRQSGWTTDQGRALDKRQIRHVPSYLVVLGSYIASFCGGGGRGGDKGGEKKRDDNDDGDDDEHDDEEDEEDKEER